MNQVHARPEWPASHAFAPVSRAPQPPGRSNAAIAVIVALAVAIATLSAGLFTLGKTQLVAGQPSPAEPVAVAANAAQSDIAPVAASDKPASIWVVGAIDLYHDDLGDSYDEKGGACFGIGGFNDMQAGATVKVRGATGQVVGTGSLEAGQLENDYCTFAFTIHDIPSAESSYSVEISHRGTITYTASEIEGDTLYAYLTL